MIDTTHDIPSSTVSITLRLESSHIPMSNNVFSIATSRSNRIDMHGCAQIFKKYCNDQ
jgi:hypothetical protein